MSDILTEPTENPHVILTVGAIVRDEGMYIAEWASFLHLVGIDRLVCVLHKCTDNTKQQLELVRDVLGMDIRIHETVSDGQIQMSTYRWIDNRYGRDTEWMIFLDADEYPYNPSPSVNYREDIKGSLMALQPDITAVSINAKVFGPHKQIVNPPYRLTAYQERLSPRSTASQAVKTFYKPTALSIDSDGKKELVSPHFQQTTGRQIRANGASWKLVDGWRCAEPPVWDKLCFNHYHTQSVESWIKRANRGSVNDPRPNQAYSIEYFLSHARNMEKDEEILRYVSWHKQLMEKLQ